MGGTIARYRFRRPSRSMESHLWAVCIRVLSTSRGLAIKVDSTAEHPAAAIGLKSATAWAWAIRVSPMPYEVWLLSLVQRLLLRVWGCDRWCSSFLAPRDLRRRPRLLEKTGASCSAARTGVRRLPALAKFTWSQRGQLWMSGDLRLLSSQCGLRLRVSGRRCEEEVLQAGFPGSSYQSMALPSVSWAACHHSCGRIHAWKSL